MKGGAREETGIEAALMKEAEEKSKLKKPALDKAR